MCLVLAFFDGIMCGWVVGVAAMGKGRCEFTIGPIRYFFWKYKRVVLDDRLFAELGLCDSPP
jgi:hypothetical protein